jgi:hypothetical protein
MLWAAFCHHPCINRCLSTIYHQQTVRQTECQNQTLELYRRAYVNYLQDDWVHWLPLAESPYNNSIHASAGVTPFFAEKAFQPSIVATVRAVQADGSVPNVPDAKAQTEKLV